MYLLVYLCGITLKKTTMKKIIVSLLLFTGVSISVTGQTLTNPGFENWYNPATYSADTVPNNWWSMFCNTTHQTTDSYNGAYATRLQGAFVCGIAPGIMVNGAAPADMWSVIESGTPFNVKPNSIGGYYKYTDVEPGDMAEVTVILKRYNTTTMQRDTVGFGTLLLPATASYALFNVPMSDMMPGLMPDSIIIMFNSSKYNMFNMATMALPNLYIDRIMLPQTPTGIEENTGNYLQSSVFPNPFHNETSISISGDINEYDALSITIFDEQGRKVKELENIHESTVTIGSSGLSQGSYFYRIQNRDQLLGKGKMILR